jgi:subtilisin family serine protease
MIFNRKNKTKNSEQIGLLPYISQPLYGFSSESPQLMGWEISDMNIPELWKESKGKGVVCAVLDTGCDLDHEDLKDNLLEGKNFIEKNKKPFDVNGHGTHVSSTICAVNNNKGIVGVAPESKVVPVKVLDNNGNGSMESITQGIYWSADQSHIDFITMSLGSDFSNINMKKAVDYANSKGKVIFCAAGNSGKYTDIMFPAKYENTIAIGAIDKNFNRTQFTCSGESLDFLAPGDEILGCTPNNTYSMMSGTSMSNPFAVGLAALLLSYNKKHTNFSLKNYSDYIAVFKKYAIDLKQARYTKIKKYQGYGIINLPRLNNI